MKDFRELIGTVTVVMLSCNAYLNDQPGFDDHHYVWKCTECGHKNSISADDIYESEEDFRNYNK